MSYTKERIKEIEKKENLTEREIYFQIVDLCGNQEKLDDKIIAERLAFSFDEFKISDIDINLYNVDEKCLFYWKKRMDETENSIFKARYSLMLLKFFKKSLESEIKKFEIAEIYVGNLIDIIQYKKIKQNRDLTKKIACALKITIKYNLLKKYEDIIKKNIINLEKYLISVGDLGVVGFSLNILEKQRKKFKFAEDEKHLLDILKKYYYDLIKDEDKDPFYLIKNLALSLADYYKHDKKLKHSQEIILSFVNAIERYNYNNAQKKFIIKESIDICSQYSIDKKIISKLKNKLLDFSKNQNEIKKLDMKIPIPEEYIKFIEDITKGDAEEILMKLAACQIIIPDFKDNEKQVNELSKTTPFLSMLPITIIDEKGVEIANINPPLNNLSDNNSYKKDYNYLSTIHGMNLSAIHEIILDFTFDKIRKENLLNADDIILFLKKSPIFDNNMGLIKKGIEFYFSGDIIISIHILIPQIEKIIRNLTELNEKAIKSNNKINMSNIDSNGQKYRSLKDLLNNDCFILVFGERSGDIPKYFDLLLINKLGKNIRNKVYHGLVDENFFTYKILDRLIHILLILGYVR